MGHATISVGDDYHLIIIMSHAKEEGGRNADGGGNNSHSGSDRLNNRHQYTPKCQICKVLGHVALDCPEQLNPTSGSSFQANLTQAFNAVSLNSGETSD